MLFTFAFSNSSAIVQQNLQGIDYQFVITLQNIEQYLQILLSKQPHYILGIGEYSGRDQQKVRIETVTKNQFRNKEIDKNQAIKNTISITPFISVNQSSKLATGLGNSWCNLLSWHIMQLIQNQKLDSHYCFLHIPQSLNTNQAVLIVKDMLTMAREHNDHFQKSPDHPR